jgi:hypothetical protein
MYFDTPTAKYMREYRLKKKSLTAAEHEPRRVSGRWKPGESGNPLGRPKRLPFNEAQAALLVKLGDLDSLKAKLNAQTEEG